MRRRRKWAISRRNNGLVLICSWALILAASVTFHPVGAVRCYFCTVKPSARDRQSSTSSAHSASPKSGSNDTGESASSSSPRLCSAFDGGERFEVDCPLSTLCEARTFQLHTQGGTISVTTRGCAQQDYSYQTYRRGRGWSTVTSVDEDAYDTGCFDAVGSDTLRRHRTTYCFCATDLCNGHVNVTQERPTSGQDGVISRWTVTVVIITLAFVY